MFFKIINILRISSFYTITLLTQCPNCLFNSQKLLLFRIRLCRLESKNNHEYNRHKNNNFYYFFHNSLHLYPPYLLDTYKLSFYKEDIILTNGNITDNKTTPTITERKVTIAGSIIFKK